MIGALLLAPEGNGRLTRAMRVIPGQNSAMRVNSGATFLTYSRRPSAAAGCARLASLAVLAGQHRGPLHADVDELDAAGDLGLAQVAPAGTSVKATAARRADARACRPRLDSRAGRRWWAG